MRKIAIMLIAAVAMAALPAFAADMNKEQKDQCLLASKGCAAETDSIQKKIKKLQAEVKKGNKAYSADEIKKLEAKLKEAEDLLDNMLKNP